MSYPSILRPPSPVGIETALSALIPDGVLLVDQAGTIVYANSNAERLLGYPVDELLSSSVDLLLPQRMRVHHAEHRKAYLACPTSRPMGLGSDYVALRKEGTELPLEIMLTPLETGGRQLTVAFIRDISARKNAEVAVACEKERMEMTLASIGDAVVTTDPSGRITYLNPMAEKLTGWSHAKACGLLFPQVVCLVDDHARQPLLLSVEGELNADYLASQLADIADKALLIRRDGQAICVADSVAVIRDPRGKDYGMVVVFRDVTERRRLTKELHYQSTHDQLTHLVNRHEFERRLRRILTENTNESHAILYLDLDRFKIVNDTCGHMAGDALLRQLASLLQRVVRKRDTLARLGGDEFGVLLEHCSPKQAERIANNLRAAVESFRFRWEKQSFRVGVSVGLASIPEAGTTLSEVLQAADSACYAAKDAGRHRVHRYQPDDGELHQRRGEMRWIPRLQTAIEEGRFCLYRQSIVALKPHHPFPPCAEVLLRLQEETGDLTLPGSFIPAAERFDCMQSVDRWVVNGILDHLKAHRALHATCFTINISGQSLSDPAFRRFVAQAIHTSAVSPSQLCFEITETAAITHLRSAQHFIDSLKSLGCRFALDDFGSGLSSFAYLKDLPVDFLKIDGAFVRNLVNDPADRAMVKAIHEVAQALQLRTIAESVEDTATLDSLKAMGIDFAQGYVFDFPSPLNVELRNGLEG